MSDKIYIMSAIKNIELPNIGDFDEVEVIEILVSVGDKINADDSIITLESDKASMEIPTPSSGVVSSINVNIGDKIKQGDVVVTLESDEEVERGIQSNTKKAEISESVSSKIVAVNVPDIGDFDEVEVIEILVAAGDIVSAEDSIITLESDKASMEIPTPVAGKIIDININLGDKLKLGSLILNIETTSTGLVEPTENSTPVATSKPANTSTSKAQPIAVADQH